MWALEGWVHINITYEAGVAGFILKHGCIMYDSGLAVSELLIIVKFVNQEAYATMTNLELMVYELSL